MKLGLLTAAFPSLTLEQVAQWAHDNGFEALEIACWPSAAGEGRRYAGVAHIDVDRLEPKRVRDLMRRYNLEISSLAYYPNNLDPDSATRQAANDHLRGVIEAAERLEVETVGTFVGRDQNRSLADNLEDFKKVWPPIIKFAAQHKVKVAIENCPMIFSSDEWPGGRNLAYSPAIWRQMFELIPDENFGLNFDPSHLVWQFIDYTRAVREFGPRIFHVHAKDMEIDRDGLYENGVMSAGLGWQVPRLPGLGEVRWDRFISTLYAIGYDWVVSIEHEDRKFEGELELVQRGFLVARNTLRPLLV
ncbi:MAG: sugar phosphate isomerase/epimerase [Chloroflexi bacterium]|nr:MAG: sugar phosphate isomerase/epimerase [Chloroflexota bacterium]TMG67121.1 MAG: sugar phosphate isomerase/epimerase [Chloroflexota bacterium]